MAGEKKTATFAPKYRRIKSADGGSGKMLQDSTSCSAESCDLDGSLQLVLVLPSR